MESRRLRAVTATIFFLFVLNPRSSRVWAHSGEEVCPEDWEWSENSLEQDPCQIISILDAKCRSAPTHTTLPLNTTGSFPPPQRDNALDLQCLCDTITYSLFMACAECQSGHIYPWTEWNVQCDSVFVAQYPHTVPEETAIPHWASFNVTTLSNQTFDVYAAMDMGREPEMKSGAGGGPGGGHHGSGDTLDCGAIIGGSVAGVVFLVLLAIGAYVYLRRREKRRKSQLPPPPPDPKDVLEHRLGQQVSFVFSKEASEQRKQPTSPAFGAAGAKPPGSPYSTPGDLTYVSPLTYATPLPHVQGQYRGIAEVENVRGVGPVEKSRR